VLNAERTADPEPADGTKVAFGTDRSGRGREIWIASLDGKTILYSGVGPNANADLMPSRTSADGRA